MNFFVMQIKYPFLIQAIWDPIILGSFPDENHDQLFLDKYFVFCELVMYKLSIKSDVIAFSFLLPVLNDGRGLV